MSRLRRQNGRAIISPCAVWADREPGNQLELQVAGGGFVSTPDDLVRFASALLKGDLVSEARFAELTTPRKMANGKINPQQYALGWRTGTMSYPKGAETTTPIIHHGGTALGSQCMLMMAPDALVAVAICGNAFTGGSDPLSCNSRPISHGSS